MNAARDVGTRAVATVPDPALPARLLSQLSTSDDALLAAYVEDGSVPFGRLRSCLAAQTRRAQVHPVFFGSAITGAGVAELTEGIATLLPAGGRRPGRPAVRHGVQGRARPGRREDRVRAGVRRDAARARPAGRRTRRSPASACSTAAASRPGRPSTRDRSASCGGCGRCGSATRSAPRAPARPSTSRRRRWRPSWSRRRASAAGCRPRSASSPSRTRSSTCARTTSARSSTSPCTARCRRRSLEATLADDYGLAVTFRETTTICVERPTGIGDAYELMGEGNPFLATVGLRVEPGPVGSGIEFRLEVELGSMPYAFFRTVEDTVRSALGQGLYGWQVVDCVVTMTHSGYCAAAEPRAPGLRQEHVQHGLGLPRPDAAGADGRAAAGRHHGAGADRPVPAGGAGRHASGR